MQDRRRHVRANVPLVATARREGGKLGDYLVRNLSAGGALLVHGPPLRTGERLDLVLQGACARPFRIVGVVVRADVAGGRDPTAAIAFRAVGQGQQDFLQNLVLGALELERESAPKVLVFDSRPTFLAPMARDATSLRRRVLLAMTAIEVIRYLGDPDMRLGALVVDLARDPLCALEALDIARQRFPAARRIAVCASAYRRELSQVLARAQAHAVINLPWTTDELSLALRRSGRGLPMNSASPRSISIPP